MDFKLIEVKELQDNQWSSTNAVLIIWYVEEYIKTPDNNILYVIYSNPRKNELNLSRSRIKI